MRVGEWVLPVSSNLFNGLNFVLFDVVLVSLVFHLTADVTGRLNDLTLADGSPQEVILCCPPLLGGGLCATRRPRQIVMLLLRALALALILAANLCIRGSLGVRLVRAPALVRAPGSLRALSDAGFQDAMISRALCVVAANRSRTYGQLRGPPGDLRCVQDAALLEEAVVFHPEERSVALSTGKCSGKVRYAPAGAIAPTKQTAEFECEHARLMCYFQYPGDPELRCKMPVQLDGRDARICPRTCMGVVHAEGTIYLCRFNKIFPGVQQKRAECSSAQGLAWKLTHWMDALFFVVGPVDIADAIDGMYGAGAETREALWKETFSRTHVSYFWALALVLKLGLVLFLAVSSFLLRRAGFRRVLHDERSLTELLGNGLQMSSQSSMDSSNRSGSSDVILTAEIVRGPSVVYSAVSTGSRSYANMDIDLREREFW